MEEQELKEWPKGTVLKLSQQGLDELYLSEGYWKAKAKERRMEFRGYYYPELRIITARRLDTKCKRVYEHYADVFVEPA